MEKLRILIDEKSIESTELGSIWSIFFLQLGEECFPFEQWDDLCADILSMWIPSMDKLLQGYSEQVDLYFMDGPYFLTLKRENNHEASVRFFKRDIPTAFSNIIDIYYFARQMLSACEKVCKHWPLHDRPRKIVELTSHASALRLTLSRIKAQ